MPAKAKKKRSVKWRAGDAFEQRTKKLKSRLFAHTVILYGVATTRPDWAIMFEAVGNGDFYLRPGHIPHDAQPLAGPVPYQIQLAMKALQEAFAPPPLVFTRPRQRSRRRRR